MCQQEVEMDMRRLAFVGWTRWGGLLRSVSLSVAFLGLASCVASETSLVGSAVPTLGPLFTVQVFRDFVDGRAHDLKASTYKWEDGAYVNVGGAPDLRRIVSVPLGGDLQLVQGSDAKKRIFTY
jgi:hypothetical protein